MSRALRSLPSNVTDTVRVLARLRPSSGVRESGSGSGASYRLRNRGIDTLPSIKTQDTAD